MASEVERLRNELRNRRKAVSSKISRIKREYGAEISGSNFDPRRKSGLEKHYNKRQLQHHLSELNQFMARGNQFVGGAGGAPIKRGTFNVLSRRAEAVRNAAEAHNASMRDIPAPLLGKVNKGDKGATLGETRAMLHPKADGGVKGPYSTLSLDPGSIAGESAAKKLAADALRQMKVSYLPSKIAEGRANLKKALDVMGETGLIDKVDKLSDEQFDVMWFGSAFAEITFMKYDIEQERAAGTPKEEWQNKAVDNAFDDIGTFLDWASELPENGSQKAGPSARKK